MATTMQYIISFARLKYIAVIKSKGLLSPLEIMPGGAYMTICEKILNDPLRDRVLHPTAIISCVDPRRV